MNELSNNKRIVSFSLVFIAVLTAYFAVKVMNEVRAGQYIGAGTGQVNTITVSGLGEVQAVPDIATVSFTIRAEAATSADAQNKVTALEKKSLDFLASAGVEKKDIKTEYNNVNPKYDWGPQIYCIKAPCPERKQTIVGYEAAETISVKIRKTEDTGKVTAGLTAVGITEINGPNYTLDDDNKYKDEARAKAIADAKDKAENLAKQLGVSIVRITSYSENGYGGPMYYAKAEMAMDAGNSVPPSPELPKGENTITSNVTITYEIR